MPKSGRPVMINRRKSWSLVSSRNARSWIAPAMSVTLALAAMARSTCPAETLAGRGCESPGGIGRPSSSHLGCCICGSWRRRPAGHVGRRSASDLLIAQRAAHAVRKGQASAFLAGREVITCNSSSSRHDRQEQRIVQRRAGAQLAVGTMTTGTMDARTASRPVGLTGCRVAAWDRAVPGRSQPATNERHTARAMPAAVAR